MICVGALIKKKGKYLIARRANVVLSGYWEFPGGKVEKNETDEEALVRELKEELNISVKIKSFFASNLHKYQNGEILLKIYIADLKESSFELNVHDKIKWVTVNDITNYKFAPADIPIVKKIIESSMAPPSTPSK